MELLKTYIDEIEAYIPKMNHMNQNVSQVNVGWHLAHSLIVINGIIKTIANSNPEEFKSSFNIKRSIVFSLNRLPRGKAKSPKSVHPDESITEDDLRKKIIYARENILKLKDLDKNKWFSHPSFGHLNLKKTKKFLSLHTLHHIKIIRDILKE